MISSDVLLGSQDILDDSSWGPQKRFFGFSFGGYVEGGGDLIGHSYVGFYKNP